MKISFATINRFRWVLLGIAVVAGGLLFAPPVAAESVTYEYGGRVTVWDYPAGGPGSIEVDLIDTDGIVRHHLLPNSNGEFRFLVGAQDAPPEFHYFVRIQCDSQQHGRCTDGGASVILPPGFQAQSTQPVTFTASNFIEIHVPLTQVIFNVFDPAGNPVEPTDIYLPAQSSSGSFEAAPGVTMNWAQLGYGYNYVGFPAYMVTGGVHRILVTAKGYENGVYVTVIPTGTEMVQNVFLTPPDTSAPQLGLPAWTTNPMPLGGTTTLSVPATDDGSGVVAGEYFIGSDPGTGNGTPMKWDGTQVTAALGATLTEGFYDLGIRARDAAGNWSTVAYTTLTVYDPSGPSQVTGDKKFTPALTNNNLWPGLIEAGQNDKAEAQVQVAYGANGGVATPSTFTISYDTGTACNSPHPQNCNTTLFTATSFSGLVFEGANNETAVFEGTGTLDINGTVATYGFHAEIVDGTRIGSTTDTLAIKLYTPGELQDPQATPVYRLTATLNNAAMTIN